ncbi:MAG: YkgJ family cysteine cluster protein [Ignisphaera sp.]
MVIFRCLLKGHCCKKYWIPVTHLDLLRLHIYAGIEIKPSIINLYESSLYEDLTYPRVIFKNESYFLALNSKDDSSCIFLSKEGKCNIHPYKPLVCRFYPFVYIEKESEIDIEINENALGECPGLIIDKKPIPDSIKRDLIRLAQVRILELKMWGRVAEEWNSSEYSKKEFDEVAEKFLGFIMSRAEEDRKKLVESGLWIP